MRSTLPRIVWLLWLQGWSNAPEIATACRRTWEHFNGDWDIRLLTEDTLADFVDLQALVPDYDPRMPKEAFSDIVRIDLLRRYGGVWADATTFCLQPLDVWLAPYVEGGFFAFADPGPDRKLSTWFLAAQPGSYIVEQWHRATRDYWAARRERHHYFWFHYLFGDLWTNDPLFRTLWDAGPRYAADLPIAYVPYDERLSAPVTPADIAFIATPSAPVVKLTHKLDGIEDGPASVLRYFLSWAEGLSITGRSTRLETKAAPNAFERFARRLVWFVRRRRHDR